MVKVVRIFAVLLLVSVALCVWYWIDSRKYTRAHIRKPLPRVEELPYQPLKTPSPHEARPSLPNKENSWTSPPPPKSWKPGSFCDDFIDHAIGMDCKSKLKLIGGEFLSKDPKGCYSSPSSNSMGACVIYNMAIQPSKLHEAWKVNVGDLEENKMAMRLLKKNDSVDVCFPPGLKNKEENGDWLTKTIQVLLSNEPISQASCKLWVNKTTYFFPSPSVHIYFRFLVWYNLHKAITRDTPHNDPPMIVRLSDPTIYLFPEYEKMLFPTLHLFTDFPNDTVCFRQSVFVPSEFSSAPFRCKMETKLKSKCYDCDGRGLTETSLYTFRQRVIQACSLTDDKVKGSRNDSDPVRIVVILRKPYTRWEGADPNKVERRLVNEQELLSGLKSAFPVTNLSAVHMEDLPICEQIRLVHEADVLVGVHGAGLVHLWWLQEDGILIELIPSYELGNPTFRMLSTLAGRRYHGISIGSGKREVRANVPAVVETLKQAFM